MAIKTIPLSHLETELRKTLSDCVNSGDTIIVEVSDQRYVSIQPLDPAEDDDLIDDLLASNTEFQALLAKSKAGLRKPFAFSENAAGRPD